MNRNNTNEKRTQDVTEDTKEGDGVANDSKKDLLVNMILDIPDERTIRMIYFFAINLRMKSNE